MSEVFDPLKKMYEFSSVRRVLFGANAVKRVGAEAKQLHVGKNCLIVTDTGVVKTGLVDKVLKHLTDAREFNVEVWDKVVPEPTLESVENLIDFAKKIEVDFIIGLGGGSSMDSAKILGRALTNPGNLKEYLEKPWSKPSIPVITIPTTAGTGAEVTPAGVIILPEERVKGWFNGVQATVAIVDPLMSLTMPPKLTAATGIDALSHAIESALSTEAFPLTRTLAIEAIKLISRNLRRATYHGNDLEARYNMALAALLAGLSEGNAGDIEAHAIAHVIGAFYQIPHGIACGIALPYVMEYNLPVNEETLAHLASVMGEDTSGLSLREAAYKGIYATKELIEDVGLPVALKGVEGVDRKDIPEIVELFKTSPRIAAFFNFCKRKMTEENAIRLFEKMWNGMLGKPKS